MPPILKKFDVGGGMNQTEPTTLIDDAEMVSIVNFYPRGQSLVRRGGHRTMPGSGESEAKITQPITGLTTSQTVIWIGSQTKLWRGAFSGAGAKGTTGRVLTITEVTAGAGASALVSTLDPWTFRVLQGVLYAVRKAQGQLYRVATGGSVFLNAGIAAPGGAPTLTEDAAGGTLAAGTYEGVVTFVNSATGAESNPSPAGSVTLAAPNRRIDWSNIPTSTNAQVNSRKLYRSTVGQTGVYYLVTTIPDNATTVFADDSVGPTALGKLASFDNGVPPLGIRHIAVWRNRLFLADRTTIYPSRVGMPESFPTDNTVTVNPDDHAQITALAALDERLLIFKDGSTWALLGTGVSNFRLQLISDRHGCPARHTLAVFENKAIWFAGHDFFVSDGTRVVPIGNAKIRRLIRDAVSFEDHDFMVGTVDSARGLYYCTLSGSSFFTNPTILCYNYRTDAWSLLDSTSEEFGYIYASPVLPAATVTPYDVNVVLAGDTNGYLYVFNNEEGVLGSSSYDGPLNDQKPIVATLLTKQYDLGNPTSKKAVRRVFFLNDPLTNAAQATLNVYRDDSDLAKTVSVDFVGPRRWHGHSASTLGKLGSTVQLQLSYTGEDPLVLEGIGIEYEEYFRRQVVPAAAILAATTQTADATIQTPTLFLG